MHAASAGSPDRNWVRVHRSGWQSRVVTCDGGLAAVRIFLASKGKTRVRKPCQLLSHEMYFGGVGDGGHSLQLQGMVALSNPRQWRVSKMLPTGATCR
jgi:hypothetical protein